MTRGEAIKIATEEYGLPLEMANMIIDFCLAKEGGFDEKEFRALCRLEMEG